MPVDIKDLPEEVLLEIFKYLDAYLLKEATLVCSEWNRVISTSCETMKKFVLKGDIVKWYFPNFKTKTCKMAEDMLTLKRDYFYIDLVGIDEFTGSWLMKFAEKFGEKLLKLSYISNLFDYEFLELLGRAPKLEELSIRQFYGKSFAVEVFGSKRDPNTIVELKNLKKFVFAGLPSFLLQNIVAPELTYLECLKMTPRPLPASFEKMLKSAPKLETLIMDFGLLSGMQPGFPFKLKNITSLDVFLNFDDKIKIFLMSQAESVETFDHPECENEEFYEIVLIEFKNLKKWSSRLLYLSESEHLCNRIEPLSLEEISFPQGFLSEKVAQAVLRKCSELKSLKVIDDCNIPSHLDLVAVHNKKLEFLELRTIRPNRARFEHLKTLHLRQVDSEPDLVEFLKNNPVEILEVKRFDPSRFCSKRMIALMETTSLRRVKLNGEYIEPFDFHEVVKKQILIEKVHFPMSDNEDGTLYTFDYNNSVIDEDEPFY